MGLQRQRLVEALHDLVAPKPPIRRVAVVVPHPDHSLVELADAKHGYGIASVAGIWPEVGARREILRDAFLQSYAGYGRVVVALLFLGGVSNDETTVMEYTM
jgi:hypothetical protein